MTADEIFTHCIVEHADGNICYSCAKEAVAQEREECAKTADVIRCDAEILNGDHCGCGKVIAQAIRGRKE